MPVCDRAQKTLAARYIHCLQMTAVITKPREVDSCDQPKRTWRPRFGNIAPVAGKIGTVYG